MRGLFEGLALEAKSHRRIPNRWDAAEPGPPWRKKAAPATDLGADVGADLGAEVGGGTKGEGGDAEKGRGAARGGGMARAGGGAPCGRPGRLVLVCPGPGPGWRSARRRTLRCGRGDAA